MTSLTQQLFKLPINITTTQRNSIFFIALWTITMISVPIQKWLWGKDIIPTAITLGLITQFVAVLYIVTLQWGQKRTLIIFSIVAIMTWFAEFIGSSTGIPFGEYNYTDLLQPQIAHVPLIIPIAWFMMLAPSWAIAQTITRFIGRRSINQHLIFALISALAMTAWDLFLDPQMVSWGFWVWDNPVGYFGIPWINYFGWVLTAFVVTLVVRPQNLPALPLIAVYAVVWFLQTFGQFFFWEQQGPALVGGIVMGAFLFTAISRYRGQLR